MSTEELIILEYNYMEHYKAHKDLCQVLGPEHQQAKLVQDAMNKIRDQLNPPA